MTGYVWLVLNLIFLSITLYTAKQCLAKAQTSNRGINWKCSKRWQFLVMICTDITGKVFSCKNFLLEKQRWHWAHEIKVLFRHTQILKETSVNQNDSCSSSTYALTIYSQYTWEYRTRELFNFETTKLHLPYCKQERIQLSIDCKPKIGSHICTVASSFELHGAGEHDIKKNWSESHYGTPDKVPVIWEVADSELGLLSLGKRSVMGKFHSLQQW